MSKAREKKSILRSVVNNCVDLVIMHFTLLFDFFPDKVMWVEKACNHVRWLVAGGWMTNFLLYKSRKELN